MKRSKTKALAIDFDGVIVDSQPMHYQAWQGVINELELEVNLEPEALLGVSVVSLVASFHLPEDIAARAAKRKNEIVIHQSKHSPPPLYPSVKSTLKFLSQTYVLALVSSVEKPVAINTLKYHGLYDFFEAFILEGDYAKHKPHPDPYLVCLARLNFVPKQVIAIEDSEVGVASAKAARLLTIAISNTSARESLREADYIIERFDQIVHLVEGKS
ncbi:MAG: HAD family hydrolase [bacterium]